MKLSHPRIAAETFLTNRFSWNFMSLHFFFLSLFPFTFFSLSIFHHIHCYTHHTRFPCSFVFLFFFCFFLFFFSFLSLSLVALHKFSDFLLFHYIDPEGQSEREADISCWCLISLVAVCCMTCISPYMNSFPRGWQLRIWVYEDSES
jgi:hypothetical protein